MHKARFTKKATSEKTSLLHFCFWKVSHPHSKAFKMMFAYVCRNGRKTEINAVSMPGHMLVLLVILVMKPQTRTQTTIHENINIGSTWAFIWTDNDIGLLWRWLLTIKLLSHRRLLRGSHFIPLLLLYNSQLYRQLFATAMVSMFNRASEKVALFPWRFSKSFTLRDVFSFQWFSSQKIRTKIKWLLLENIVGK